MKISNIHFGLNANSSSTHSIIIFDKPHKCEDVDVDDNFCYGWDNFVLASKKAKLSYISVMLFHAAQDHQIPKYIWDYYVNEWLDGTDCCRGKYGNTASYDQYIDHASSIALPRYYNSHYINKEFFDEVKKYLLDKKVVICGGSDHTEGSSAKNYLTDCGKHDQSSLSELAERDFEYARKDPKYGHWVLFGGNREYCPTKIRFTFDDSEVKCSSLPELVDLKITNWCDRGCKFCYQDSTPQGQHADMYVILHILDALAEMEVFECAIGGGEPTKHPQFTYILKACKQRGIVPNFTTRDYNWFRNEANVKLFLETCGSVAFSVSSLAEVDTVQNICKYHPHLWQRASLQIIDGYSDLRYMVQKARLPVILLGYKRIGRAKNLPIIDPYRDDVTSFDTVMESANHYKVGVDTKYIQDHPEVRKDEYKYLITDKEGVFSMYIDAVERTMAESSYSGKPVKIQAKHNFGSELANEIAGWFSANSKRIVDSAEESKKES